MLAAGVPVNVLYGKIWLFDNFKMTLKQRVPMYTLRISEYANAVTGTKPNVDSIRIFEGDEDHFEYFSGRRNDILSSINERITRRVERETSGLPSNGPIVVNVRLGRDFAVVADKNLLRDRGGVRAPIDWYVTALHCARGRYGASRPAIVVSDGAPHELAPLLSEPGVSHFQSTRALSDLIALSKAGVLVATGGSSFSAWGSFLSQAHTITVAGQSFKWFGLEHSTNAEQIELELD